MLKLPNSWSDIKVGDYLKFRQTDDILEQISILCGVSLEEVINLNYKRVKSIQRQLLWMQEPPEETPETLEVHGQKYKKKPLSKMCVFEYRTYDYYGRENSHEFIKEMIATMYQFENDKWGDFEVAKRAEDFNDVTMDYWGISEFLKFKNLCFERFPLSEKSENAEEADLSKMNYIERANFKEQQEKNKVNQSLNWELIMMSINNDSMIDAYNAQFLPVLHAFRIISAKKLTKK